MNAATASLFALQERNLTIAIRMRIITIRTQVTQLKQEQSYLNSWLSQPNPMQGMTVVSRKQFENDLWPC